MSIKINNPAAELETLVREKSSQFWEESYDRYENITKVVSTQLEPTSLLKDSEISSFKLDPRSVIQNWRDNGVLNRIQKDIGVNLVDLHSEVFKIPIDTLVLLFHKIFDYEDSKGIVEWKNLTMDGRTKQEILTDIKQAEYYCFLTVLHSDDKQIRFDYSGLFRFFDRFTF